jgi:hypothetical protein
MGKYFGIFTLIVLFGSCNIVDTESVIEENVSLKLDGRLPMDTNGYYHLKLTPFSNQTIHRITGRVSNTYEPTKVEWESNLYWWLLKGQVVAQITKTYFNPLTGELQYVNLPPLTNWQDVLVPTINTASYVGNDGEINTVIAPIYSMKTDTLVLNARIIETTIKKQIKIVLE